MKIGIKCLKCGDLIISEYRHDFKWCKCENIFIDGGDDYLRRGGDGLKDESFEHVEVYRDHNDQWKTCFCL